MSAPEVPSQAVILAGGRGTRLAPLTDTRPKPMLEFGGRPFLEYLVEQLREQGVRRVLLLLGYLPEAITQHFGDGSRFGLQIEYAVSPVEDDTGTRLRRVRDRVDERFAFMYCDNYCPVDLRALTRAHTDAGRLATLTVYRNADGYTRSNLCVEDGLVVVYDKSRQRPELAGVDIGYAIFEAPVLDLIPHDGNPSFEASVYPQLVARRELGAFVTDHRYYSVGSHERLASTAEFLKRHKTVLVDRDGTLNVRMPRAQYVTQWSEFRWLPGAREALAVLSRDGYRIVVVTNQPGVARGALTEAALATIHCRMVEEAAAAGATIDAVLFCPHGWDEGCACRKPRPGLLLEAQRRFDLDLSRVPFLGDDERDAQAAQAAGSPFYHVSELTPLSAVAARLVGGERTFRSAS